MQIIRHRINKIADLKTIATNHGVEIDLRSDVNNPGALHLSHDPWVRGDDFEAWLEEFCRISIQGPIILNTKEDLLEEKIEVLLKKKAITNYFFLDTAAPTLVRLSQDKVNKSHLCVRLSKYEPLSAVVAFQGKVDWIWVDCFEGIPLSLETVAEAKKTFKVCLVSPELQKSPKEKIREFSALKKIADAVCTKDDALWSAS